MRTVKRRIHQLEAVYNVTAQVYAFYLVDADVYQVVHGAPREYLAGCAVLATLPDGAHCKDAGNHGDVGGTMNLRQRRIQQLERQARRTHQSFEVWIGGEDDDNMLGPNGEGMSVAEFERRYPGAVDIGGTRPPMVPNAPNAYKE